MAETIPFFIYSKVTGLPLEGLVPSFNYFRRRNADGSVTDLAPGPDILEADGGGGAYEAQVDGALITPGSILRYIIDCTTDSAARFLEGQLLASDAQIGLAGSVVIVEGDEILLDTGDQAPPFVFTLKDQDGAIVDLTDGAPVVTFSMSPAAGGDPIIDEDPVTIVDPALGLVRYAWGTDATAAAGDFFAHFGLNQNSLSSSYPVARAIVVRVRDRLG
jgi:hypothetical protein